MKIPKMYHDPRGDQPCEIQTYLHCGECLREIPEGVAPREWARLNFGLTGDGSLQLWCARHNINVDVISVKPRKGIDYGDESAKIVPGTCAVCGAGSNEQPD